MKAPASNEIVIFDFLSHEAMHHAFNEGYIRIIRAAFPESTITFYASEGQIRHLKHRVADLDDVVLRPCATFTVPFGLSRHNPVAGRWAAVRCLRAIASRISPANTKLVAVLGVDANLFAVLGRRWPRISPAPLHMILHSHLGDAMVWRSRNPWIRAGDFISQLRHPLPPQVRLVVLELGIKSAIAEIAPQLMPSIVTLEHPTLPSEWIEEMTPRPDGKVVVAFLGHARRAKGFPAFVELARRCGRTDLDFRAIGLSSPDTADLDVSALSRKPSPTPLPRKEYLRALAEVDLVCLPLHSRAYDFTASGTISDAIAALKPVLALRNRTLDEMACRYGPIGHLVDKQAKLIDLVQSMGRASFLAELPVWRKNLHRLREARRPVALAAPYLQQAFPARDTPVLGLRVARARRTESHVLPLPDPRAVGEPCAQASTSMGSPQDETLEPD